MIPVRIESLMLGFVNSPSVLVLRPLTHKQGADYATLPIWIGTTEAASIVAALDNRKSSRPLTHSLIKNIINSLNGEVVRVVINRVEGTTFYAKIVIRQNTGSYLHIDSRPSDAIALAVRCNVPLFVDEKVMEVASAPISLAPGSERKIEMEEFHKFIQNVSPEDFSAR